MRGEEFHFDRLSNNSDESIRSAESALITLERAQKLDLLIHLITNLRQSLVICGPKGIGKTKLLDELKIRKHDVWPIYTIQASTNLSFEALQSKLLTFLIQHYPENKQQSLDSVLSSLDKKAQKIVILIDSAGHLVPGLISTIIQYAAAHECLRFVFSLTQDEVHLKSSSDREIDDCHFIEIPPLNEKQCGIFLQNLSGKQNAAISFGAINERLVERIYKKTHGNPGGIISELPKMAHYKASESNGRLIGIIFLAIVIVGIINVFVFNEENEDVEIKDNKVSIVLETAEKIDITPPVVYTDISDGKSDDMAELKVKEVVDPVTEILDEKEPPLLDSTLEKSIAQTKEVVIEKKVEVVAEEPVKKLTKKIAEPENEKVLPAIVEIKKEDIEKNIKNQKLVSDDSEWLLSQPKNNYTIQLMVLSSRKSVDEFFKSNKNLKLPVKFFQINPSKPKYVLIYGSFKNRAIATNKLKSLPAKYKASWLRKMSAVQKGITNNQ